MGRIRDITGQRFGRLVAIEPLGVNKHHHMIWKCKCDCGQYTEATVCNLVSGNTISCGCYFHESVIKNNHLFKTTHGMTHTRLHNIWNCMRARCYYKKDKCYKDYGGRGIYVCDEWKNDFMTFYNWAVNNGYSDELSIDRIDVDGNYEPNNCRWATAKEQANNKRCHKHNKEE